MQAGRKNPAFQEGRSLLATGVFNWVGILSLRRAGLRRTTNRSNFLTGLTVFAMFCSDHPFVSTARWSSGDYQLVTTKIYLEFSQLLSSYVNSKPLLEYYYLDHLQRNTIEKTAIT